jgi:hypothetical protein
MMIAPSENLVASARAATANRFVAQHGSASPAYARRSGGAQLRDRGDRGFPGLDRLRFREQDGPGVTDEHPKWVTFISEIGATWNRLAKKFSRHEGL